MSKRLWYQRVLCIVLLISVIYTGYVIYSYVDKTIPDKIHVVVNEDQEFNFRLPIEAEMISPSEEVVFSGESNIPSNEITVNLNNSFFMRSNETGNYTIKMKLFGIFPMKEIEVSVIENTQVIPCGFPVGIYLETNGILVVGTSKLSDTDGNISEPAYSIVNSGDYITQINHEEISTKEDMIRRVRDSQGEELILTIRRGEEESDVKIKPVKTGPDEYKLGIWVRDDAQGIGTLTYITADGKFGALGHGVSDIDTGTLLEAYQGTLYEAKILSIIKGQSGNPGGLSGIIHYNDSAVLGRISQNTSQGIFGETEVKLQSLIDSNYIDIGLKQEVELGTAYIRCEIEGKIEEYEIRITKIDNSSNNLNKGMEIKVVDPKLLEKTNGIVQGMSGSPIIQNGKLIGAVTHVFVQDSTKGYGIFIENMLNHKEK